MIDHLIETGSSEQIFENAIQGIGRGQVDYRVQLHQYIICSFHVIKAGNSYNSAQMFHNCTYLQIIATVKEIHERHDVVMEIEKKLLELQQVALARLHVCPSELSSHNQWTNYIPYH